MPPAESHHPQEVVCTDLGKIFRVDGREVDAVRPLDLTFAAGQTTVLVGPSGCGKSTLLRLVAGLEKPSGGSVRIGGKTPQDVTRQAGLAIAFQDAALLPWLTVRQNVALALKLARRPVDHEKVAALIGVVGLSQFIDTRPAELSGGMRQRAAIARCLVTEPGLLLLDEPFGAVDELTRARLNQELPTLWQRRGTTTLLVTHSITEAVTLGDRVIVFSPRPARVIADIIIPPVLAAPDRRSTEDPGFRAMVAQIAGALTQDADGQSP